ncbi:hypothetical protein A2160_04110 [Candidatus Beckwithbacteria bacterium RBG_13_42_9]|uniref:Uncharacterized protein n=1 Tax=Candidatus Beckwithbacteria bacterium RBG_13_42_9 TaxID=1797457 RepID=A0A1F5E693_9BACT|nr:MAG: hypothetical protein A2160_04110 [Candidatus Beckwithbacteria bacterium RBG_13_42_9]
MLDQLADLYGQFLSIFPAYLHFWISLVIFIALVLWLVDLVKKHWIWILLLIIFIPASIPLLRQIGKGIIDLLGFLLPK